MNKEELFKRMKEYEKQEDIIIIQDEKDVTVDNIYSCLDKINYDMKFDLDAVDGIDYYIQASVYVNDLLGKGKGGYNVIINTDRRLPETLEELADKITDTNKHAQKITNHFK